MIPRSFLVALALPLAFAAVALAARAGNASGGRGPIALSEREAIVSPRTEDRSVAEVWITWNQPAGRPGAWMTRDMLEAVGFDVDVDAADPGAETSYRRQLSRRAFVAFELDGPAWDAVVAEREAMQAPATAGVPRLPEQGIETMLASAPRLVPVDVARDAEALSQRYPDVRTHLIAAAVVRIARFEDPREAPYVGGMLVKIDPQRVQVPSELAAALPVRDPVTEPRGRYTVGLTYGARWEPRVVTVEPVPQP